MSDNPRTRQDHSGQLGVRGNFRPRAPSGLATRTRWYELFDRSIGWASVLPTEDWQRPYRIMGPIKLNKIRPPPPPPRCFDCELLNETEKAWLVEIEGHEYWLPKSRCKLGDDERHVEIEDWLWRQKVLEREDNQEEEYRD